MYKKILLIAFSSFYIFPCFASQDDRAENVIKLIEDFYLNENDEDFEDYIIQTCQESMGNDIGQININYQDETGSTFLHYASVLNSPKIAQVLLDLGANPNLQDKKGVTALHVAVDVNNIDVINLLLAYPLIYIFAQDQSGDTALDKAIKSRLPQAEQLLLEKENEILNQSGVTDDNN